jgi:ComF family protein
MCSLCRYLPVHFDSVRSPFPYSGVIGELIRRLKYQRGSWAAKVLARLSVSALGDWFHHARETRAFDLVVPVPMHALRELWRGSNHSEELAREFATLLGSGVVFDPLAVRRRRRTPQQSRRHGVEKRLQNVQGCFDVPEPAHVMGRRILLVDDVMTTGATAATCAQALKEAGAREVHVLTICRAGELATEPASLEMRGLAKQPGESSEPVSSGA